MGGGSVGGGIMGRFAMAGGELMVAAAMGAAVGAAWDGASCSVVCKRAPGMHESAYAGARRPEQSRSHRPLLHALLPAR
jgi:hypothetical protein